MSEKLNSINDKDINVEHLQIIEGVIDRMAGNSASMKGWFLAVVSALLGFAFSNGNSELVWIALVSTFSFCGMDTYYLMLERRFRKLYSAVISPEHNVQPFSMDPWPYLSKKESFISSIFSHSTIWFYLPIAIGIVVILCLGAFGETGTQTDCSSCGCCCMQRNAERMCNNHDLFVSPTIHNTERPYDLLY